MRLFEDTSTRHSAIRAADVPIPCEIAPSPLPTGAAFVARRLGGGGACGCQDCGGLRLMLGDFKLTTTLDPYGAAVVVVLLRPHSCCGFTVLADSAERAPCGCTQIKVKPHRKLGKASLYCKPPCTWFWQLNCLFSKSCSASARRKTDSRYTPWVPACRTSTDPTCSTAGSP